ncbi:endonuclease III [candidate division KSB1 bacterium]|nr:endonuclease III [candidate division KSB1 bacterium]
MPKDRSQKIISRLLQHYPDPEIELNFSNAFELLVAAILAAQCTDARVNQVTESFFKTYPTPDKIANESIEAIEEQIRSTGFYHNKAKSLIACCKTLVSEHQGQVPRSQETLATLPGVGRKTAAMVVSNAYGIPAITVDTHVKRVSERLGLVKSTKPDEIERQLRTSLEESQWTVFSQLLTLHGRYTCQARKPKCGDCIIRDLCPWPESE